MKATLSLERKTWTDFRVHCLREGKTASELIERMIEAYLRKKP